MKKVFKLTVFLGIFISSFSILIVGRNALHGAQCCSLGVSGADMMHFNRSLESFGLGGTSSGLEMNGGNVLVNPSLSSSMLQQMVMVNGGYGTENIQYATGTYLHPTQYGVFGGSYSYFYDITGSEYMFSVGPTFSKEINNKIAIGTILLFDYYLIDKSVADIDRNPLGFNISLSISFHQDWNYQQWFFVLKKFIATVQVDQAGLIPWRRSERGKQVYLKSMDILKTGVGFDFMEADLPNEKGKWIARLLTDFALTYPINFSYHVGFKNSFLFNNSKFKEFSIMLGNYLDPIVDKTLPLTGGLGTVFMLNETLKMEIHYAFSLKYRATIESSHSLGFKIYFGEVDNSEPEISSPLGNEGVIETGVIE